LASARFWLIITNVERKIASSDTITVRVPLDAEDDSRTEPERVQVHEGHRACKIGDAVDEPVLPPLRSLAGVLWECRVVQRGLGQPLQENGLLISRLRVGRRMQLPFSGRLARCLRV
jgi:hypothetical protein